MESFTITIRSKVGAHWPIVVELSGAKTPLVIRREGVLELDLEALWTQVTRLRDDAGSGALPFSRPPE
jgi:hypothetical protein